MKKLALFALLGFCKVASIEAWLKYASSEHFLEDRSTTLADKDRGPTNVLFHEKHAPPVHANFLLDKYFPVSPKRSGPRRDMGLHYPNYMLNDESNFYVSVRFGHGTDG